MVIEGIRIIKNEVCLEYPSDKPFMLDVRLKALQTSSIF